MRTNVKAFPVTARVDEAREILAKTPKQSRQHLYPVVDREQQLIGVVTRKRLRSLLETGESQPEARLGDIVSMNPATARPDEPLRSVVYRMVETGFRRFPVVDHNQKLIGMVALEDLLSARVRALGEERDRERPLRLRLFPVSNGAGSGPNSTKTVAELP
jgi:CBS domain-containing protein